MLAELGVDAVRGTPPTGAECIGPDDVPSVGIALGVFKAAQLVEMRDSSAAFTNFTAIDLETTDNDIGKAEVIEIAAVRVRNGKIAETFVSLVKPSVPITPGASEVHGIHDKDVAHAPSFAAIWPTVREFCGEDVVVAHNGYDFDFRILQRLAKAAEQPFGLCTFDSLPLSRELFATSRKLVDLARQFGIDPGTSHRALDDTKTLANVLLKLGDEKLRRGRKTALVDLLGHLGVALSLTKNKELNDEAQLFLKKLTPVYALGKYSGALDWYEQQAAGDTSIPGVEAVVEALGGMEKLLRIRSSKTADERYPAAMLRLRRLIAEIPEGTLVQQLLVFSRARRALALGRHGTRTFARELAHAAFDEGTRVLARVRRRSGGRAVARRLADQGDEAAGIGGGTPPSICGHDAHHRPAGADAGCHSRRATHRRPPVSR